MNPPPTSYLELARRGQEGFDYRILLDSRRSRTAILAPHGGEIEPGTSEIAHALAGEEFSLYCFEGLRATGNWELHLSSLHFDELGCLEILTQAHRAVAVHGCRGQSPWVYVGGLDSLLKQQVICALQGAGFAALEDNTRHAGVHPRNLCNRTLSGKGLQLELSLGFRQALFSGLGAGERQHKTKVFRTFISSLRQVFLAEDHRLPQ